MPGTIVRTMADPLFTVAATLREAFSAVTGLPAADIDLLGCLSPGVTTQACNGFQVPLPATVALSLEVSVTAEGS